MIRFISGDWWLMRFSRWMTIGLFGGLFGVVAAAASADDRPVINKVEPVEFRDSKGRKSLDLYLEVSSKTQVRSCYANLQTPIKSYLDGKNVIAVKVSEGNYACKISFPVTEWSPEGEYQFTGIYAHAPGLGTTYYGKEVSIDIKSRRRSTVPPVVTAAKAFFQGHELHLIVEAKSDAPVRRLRAFVQGDRGCIARRTRDKDRPFEERRPGVYVFEEIYELPEWTPNGTYSFSEIAVTDEAFHSSPAYTLPVQALLSGDDDEPIVKSIKVSPSKVSAAGGVVVFKAEVESTAPLAWASTMFTVAGPGLVPNTYGFDRAKRGFGSSFVIEKSYTVQPGFPSGSYEVVLNVNTESCLSSVANPFAIGRFVKLSILANTTETDDAKELQDTEKATPYNQGRDLSNTGAGKEAK